MKISHNLPRFESSRAAILVTNRRGAVLYGAHDGSLRKAGEFVVSRPEFTDKAGHFKTRAGGGVIRSGSVVEDTDKMVHRDFLRELGKLLKSRTIDDADSIYVFAPSPMKNDVKSAFPNGIHRRILTVIEGNYFRKHEFDILKRIAEFERRTPAHRPRKEAARILGIGRRSGREDLS